MIKCINNALNVSNINNPSKASDHGAQRNKSSQEITRLHSLAGFRHLRKNTCPNKSPGSSGRKKKCGTVSLRMARHNVNFYSTIVNFFNFTQLIGAWHSTAARHTSDTMSMPAYRRLQSAWKGMNSENEMSQLG